MVFYLQVNSTLEINSQHTFMHTPSWYSQGWGNGFLLSWCNIQTRSGWGLRWTKSISQYLRVWTLEKMWMSINLLQINYNLILARRRRWKIAKMQISVFFLGQWRSRLLEEPKIRIYTEADNSERWGVRFWPRIWPLDFWPLDFPKSPIWPLDFFQKSNIFVRLKNYDKLYQSWIP